MIETKKADPVMRGPTDTPARTAAHWHPTPSATIALAVSSASRNSGSVRAATSECGLAHANTNVSRRSAIADCTAETSSGNDLTPIRTPRSLLSLTR